MASGRGTACCVSHGANRRKKERKKWVWHGRRETMWKGIKGTSFVCCACRNLEDVLCHPIIT
eukprot:scaffold108548_cov22-Tisochrysis_lutea.AAC.1